MIEFTIGERVTTPPATLVKRRITGLLWRNDAAYSSLRLQVINRFLNFVVSGNRKPNMSRTAWQTKQVT